jgi:hypothetical protein
MWAMRATMAAGNVAEAFRAEDVGAAAVDITTKRTRANFLWVYREA